MPRPVPLSKVLAADRTLSEWSERARLMARLTAVVRTCLPRPVGAQVRVVDAEAHCLTLATGAGAIAASVRQRVPDLVAALRREGLDFTEIRVRVQVRPPPEGAAKKPENQRDISGARPLFELSERLSDGPLRRSLARWSRRARGR